MFIIDLSPTYFWPVRFTVPNGSGEQQTCEFEAEFTRLDVDQMTALGVRQRDEKLTDAQVVEQLLVGWRGITDRSGSAVSYSAEARARLLKIPGVAVAILDAFTESMKPPAGKQSAAEKN
jgi:hypothetical protein